MTVNMNLALLIIAVATSMICLFWLVLGSIIKAIRNKKSVKVNQAFEKLDGDDFRQHLKAGVDFKTHTKKQVEETFDFLIGLIHHHRLTLLEKIEKGDIKNVTYMPSSERTQPVEILDESFSEIPENTIPEASPEPLSSPKEPIIPQTEKTMSPQAPSDGIPESTLKSLSFKDQVTELLSMGLDDQKIAESLNRTKAEVSLMVKLHKISQPNKKTEKPTRFKAVG